MEALPRPDVILTHESDLDGFVSGHLLQRLAARLFDTEVPLEAWNTTGWRQRPMKESCAWVADLTLDARVDLPGWVIIDHHPSDTRPRHARLIHDVSRSASLLCLELLEAQGPIEPRLRRLVTLTNVGDLFLERDPDFEESQLYAALLKTYSFWNLSRLLEGRIEDLIDHPLLSVMRTKREVEDPIGLAWSRGKIVALSPQVGWVDVTVGNANLIVHTLLRENGCSHPVLATLARRGAAGVVVSLRSLGGEALDVARRLRGGGHPNAAGATLPRSVQTVPDAVSYLQTLLGSSPPDWSGLVSSPEPLRLDR